MTASGWSRIPAATLRYLPPRPRHPHPTLVAALTDLDNSVVGARLEGDKSRPRPPFSPWWIINRILAAGALETMNEEERAVVMVMINTGARPSEIINLRRKHIMLDAPIRSSASGRAIAF